MFRQDFDKLQAHKIRKHAIVGVKYIASFKNSKSKKYGSLIADLWERSKVIHGVDKMITLR